MIRIDEIYNHTFWPWLQKNRPGTRLFFCDPFGHTDPEHLFNLGRDDIVETNFVFMHDQEPVDVDLFDPLFQEVQRRNADLWGSDKKPNSLGQIVVSERGKQVQDLCSKYQWQSHYYFFHGWACLDWFRGYDRTFLIPRAQDREPGKTFMSPNRIVAGKRDHRVVFLYLVYKNNLSHNHISAPQICTYENVDIGSVASKYCNTYNDIEQVLNQASLPRLFSGENTQHMNSCWLSNFSEAQDSLVYVPTETVYFGPRTHLTEKTFKAIALEMPFVLVACAGSLEYLREYGFQTFSKIFDESYDQELNDMRRIELVVKLLKDIDSLSPRERQQIHRACLPIVQHNYNHFYHGGFGNQLWIELNNMLKGLNV
jgi:hypothetical protein